MLNKIIYKSYLLKRNYSNCRSVLNIILTGEIGEKVSVEGWVKSLRKQKEVTFLDLNDGSTCKNLQIVLPQKIHNSITVGASVSTIGILKQSPKGENEVTAENIRLLGKCDLSEGYPFAPRKEYEQEYIREYLHFRPRTRKFSSILRLRHAASLSINNYLHKNGYFQVHTPIITSNDCEGAGETFKVIPENERLLKSMARDNKPLDLAFFDKKAYLTVSGQLHLEAAAQAMSKVYCFGPTFRAENSRTRFHLSEFYMLEIEQAFLKNIDDLLNITEALIKNVTQELLDKHNDDINVCTKNTQDFSWLEKEFIKLSYSDAKDILSKKLNKNTCKGGLSKEDEIVLTKYFNIPVCIINWPKDEKPFYMKEIENQNVAAFDLLAPKIGEIAGGSLREDDYDKLKSKIATTNLNLDWYLELRKFGAVPTGGFGLGFERYIQFLIGIDNIKDVIPFPRWPHNCSL